MTKRKKYLATVALIIVAALSFFLLYGVFSTSGLANDKGDTQKYLNDKRTNILEMVAGASTVSLAVSAFPSDTGTPIANQLAKISGYLTFILAAIYFEKALVSVSGFVAFKILIPFACLLLMICIWRSSPIIKKYAVNLLVFALVIVFVVPVSVGVSKRIENNLTTEKETIVESVNVNEKDQDGDTGKKAISETNKEEKNDKNKGFFSSISSAVLQQAESIKTQVSELINNGTDKFEGIKEKAKIMLNDLVETIAVLLVTSCVMPIVVLLFLVWFFKILFNVDFVELAELSKLKRNSVEKQESYKSE